MKFHSLQSLGPTWLGNYGPGYILAFAEDASFVSEAIGWLSRNGEPLEFTHIGVCTGKDTLVEAVMKGVVESCLTDYLCDSRQVFALRFVDWTPRRGQMVADNARKLIGLPYGEGLILTDALAGSLAGRAVNGFFNWLATETKGKWLADLPNRAVSKLADWNDLAPVCSVVGALSLHPQGKKILDRGLVDVVGPMDGLTPARIVTPNSLAYNATVFPYQV